MSRRKQSNPRQIKRKFPSCCLAVPARLVEPVSPNIAAISDQSRAEAAEAQLPPLMCCLSRSTHAPLATRNYSAFLKKFFFYFFFFCRISIRTLVRCSAEKVSKLCPNAAFLSSDVTAVERDSASPWLLILSTVPAKNKQTQPPHEIPNYKLVISTILLCPKRRLIFLFAKGHTCLSHTHTPTSSLPHTHVSPSHRFICCHIRTARSFQVCELYVLIGAIDICDVAAPDWQISQIRV